MGLLRSLFGPGKEAVWQQLAREIGADFIEGGFWQGSKVQAPVKEWMVTLDTYTVSTGEATVIYTRMRAPYVNPDGFRFTFYRAGLFTELGKLLGMQDIEIGDPEFDEAFVIRGNDEGKVKALLHNPRIRELIGQQPTVFLQVKDDEGWFGARFPEGVDELYFQAHGVLRDPERLKALFDLFAEVLNHLCHLGSAYEDDPHLAL